MQYALCINKVQVFCIRFFFIPWRQNILYYTWIKWRELLFQTTLELIWLDIMWCHFGVFLVQIPTKWHGISVEIWFHVTWIPPFNIFNIFWWNCGRNSMETHRNPMESRCHIGMNLDQKDTKIWHHMTPLSGRIWWHIFSRGGCRINISICVLLTRWFRRMANIYDFPGYIIARQQPLSRGEFGAWNNAP